MSLPKTARLLTAASAAALWLASGALAQAQSEDLPPPPPGYAPVVPDVPDALLDSTRFDHHFFTLRLGIVPATPTSTSHACSGCTSENEDRLR